MGAGESGVAGVVGGQEVFDFGEGEDVERQLAVAGSQRHGRRSMVVVVMVVVVVWRRKEFT